ncbi:MAG: hypothetical protein ACRDRY_24075, partial [Pseudonocardiaceae bacterium]
DPTLEALQTETDVEVNSAPLRVGYDFEPNDLRVAWVLINYMTGTASEHTIGATPSGWSKIHEVASSPTQSTARVCVFTRQLQAGDQDASVTFGGTSPFRFYVAMAFTVRYQAIPTTPNVATTVYHEVTGVTNIQAPSVNTGAGALFNFFHAFYPDEITGASYTADPAGQFRFFSQEDLIEGGTGAKVLSMMTYEQRTSGASGTKTATLSTPSTHYYGTSFYVAQAPDVVATIGKATAEVTSAKAVTPVIEPFMSWTVDKVTEASVARPIYSPLTAWFTSDPLFIPEGLVSGSKILYRANEDRRQTFVTLETSIDGGASWQLAGSDQSVPRLKAGSTTVRSVLARFLLARTVEGIPGPRLHDFSVTVATDTGTDELMPLGLYVITEANITDTAQGLSVDIAGMDPSWRISRNKWTDVFVIRLGTRYDVAIRNLIINRRPETVFNFATTLRRTPRLIFGKEPTDPWKDAQEMATAIGMELYFDAAGVCTMREEPDPDVGDPVWTFTDLDQPTMTALTRRLSPAETFNVIIVRSEGTGVATPIRWVEEDVDPSSPTYVLGSYGRHATEFKSSMVVNADQAKEAAQALLRRHKGATEAVDLEAIPMPALEPGDIVAVTRGRSRVAGQWLIDTLSLPLGAGQLMRATMRRQRLG